MNFNANQIRAINFHNGNCCLMATAGSGKTAVLTNRIKNLIEIYGVKPENILAITFSKKAKDTMVERLNKLLPCQSKNINIETFHSLGYKIMRSYTGINYKILKDNKKVTMINMLTKEDIDTKTVINYISRQKNNLQYPNRKSVNLYDRLYYLYEQEKKKTGDKIDFDDMLLESYNILSNNADLLNRYISCYKYLLVDEVQDTNYAQNELIKLLGKNNNNVFIVGDPLQCIYNWRGSNNDYIINFHKDWENTTVINLDTNYRSTKDIVDMSNKFAETIEASKHEYYVESQTDVPYYKVPLLYTYEDEDDEADKIAEQINDFVSSEQYSYKDFCILARTNAQLQTFETTLYNNNVAYEVVDGSSFIERTEIKIILSYLKLANDIYDNESFEYIYYRPNRWLGKTFLEE